jgi:Glycine zipper
MKTLVLLSTVAATAIALSGCDTPQGQNAAGGALIGGATGAIIGSAVSGGHAGGALVGGALGAATGAMVGSAATPPGPYYGPGPGPGPYPPPPGARCAQFYYDYYGNRVCQAYY